MTATQDLFVGFLAVFVGCLLVAGAVVQSQHLMRLSKSKMLVETLGHTGARWMIAAFGLTSVALGVLIASGWRVHW
jgi:hypothetical protein